MNTDTMEILVTVSPIVLMLALGNIIRVTGILTDRTVHELKNLVVMAALPAVLFVAFLQMDLDRAYLALFAAILLVCILLLGYGFLLRRLFGINREYFPFLMTGFEFGMVGISLFGSAYGLHAVGYIAIVDLSHELFIWFVLVTILVAKRDGVGRFSGILKGFATSPLILAIVAALFLNIAGMSEKFAIHPAGAVILETAGLLGNLLIPTILIIIGYGMRLSLHGIRQALVVVAARFLFLVPATYLVAHVLVRNVLDLGPAFEAAVITFMLLPPPYIVPLFMPAGVKDERTYANNVLTVYTMVSIMLFILYFVYNPVIGV